MNNLLTALLLASTAFAGTIDAPKESKPKREKKMATEWSGSQGASAKPGVELALTDEQWTALWKRLGQPAPKVDFSANVAAAVFVGERRTSGFGVEWLAPVETKDAVIVRWREKKPAEDAMLLQVITYPWAVKLFAKTSKGLRVEAEKK